MVLDDHTRRGKKLLPPLLAADHPVRESSWHVERLPHLILLALYLESNPLPIAIETFLEMNISYSSILREFRGGKIFRPIRMGEHSTLEQFEKEAINQRSDGAAWRSSIDSVLNMISSLFVGHPMAYLSKTDAAGCVHSRAKNVKVLKDLLERTTDRHSKSALLIQTVVIATELQSGNMKVPKGLNVPELSAVLEYPNTEESRKAAGFIVTAAQSVVTGMTLDLTWPREFWQTCYHIEPCEFDHGQ